jgi:TolB protein
LTGPIRSNLASAAPAEGKRCAARSLETRPKTLAPLPWAALASASLVAILLAACLGTTPPPLKIVFPATPPLLTSVAHLASSAPSASAESTPESPTKIPTATATRASESPTLALPTPINLYGQTGTLALAVEAMGQSQLLAWPLGSAMPLVLTEPGTQDRDPAFSPDGGTLAFSSHRDGNWDVYTMDLLSGKVVRVTVSADFDGRPAWSPDGKWLAYERYAQDHLVVCISPASGGPAAWCDPDSAPDFSPAWSPSGRQIAFISERDGKAELLTLNLDNLQETAVADTADGNLGNPAYSPDGKQLAYSVQKDGYEWTYLVTLSDPSVRPVPSGQGGRPVWSPDGQLLLTTYQSSATEGYLEVSRAGQPSLAPTVVSLPGNLLGVSWTTASLPNPLPTWVQGLQAQATSLTAATPAGTIPAGPLEDTLVTLNVNAPDPRLSSAVVDRFNRLRIETQKEAGWDFLGTLDSAYVGMATPLPPTDELSWLRTGRSFAVSREAASKGWLEIVPDPQGQVQYWRLYVRTAAQDGSQGQPLHELTWNFDARSSGSPSDYDAGGAYSASIPGGYYLDFTELAEEFGWARVPSDANWRNYYPAIRYWEFRITDGLDWMSAMNEILPQSAFLTPTPSSTPTSLPYWWGPRPTDTRWPTLPPY